MAKEFFVEVVDPRRERVEKLEPKTHVRKKPGPEKQPRNASGIPVLEWHEANPLETGRTYYYNVAYAAQAAELKGHFIIGQPFQGAPWRLRWYGRRSAMPHMERWKGAGKTHDRNPDALKAAAQAMYEMAFRAMRKRVSLTSETAAGPRRR